MIRHFLSCTNELPSTQLATQQELYLVLVNTQASNDKFKRLHPSQIAPFRCVHRTSERLFRKCETATLVKKETKKEKRQNQRLEIYALLGGWTHAGLELSPSSDCSSPTPCPWKSGLQSDSSSPALITSDRLDSVLKPEVIPSNWRTRIRNAPL